MIYAGPPHDFLGDILPPDFRSILFDIVEIAWAQVPNPDRAWLEPRITGLLQRAMIAEQEVRYSADPPFFICEDVKKRDSTTGKEIERSDIEIHLRHTSIRGQKPYFVFEAKRLNIPYCGGIKSNVSEYLGEEGMGCLLNGDYDCVPGYAGMLGYVMDGNTATAVFAVSTTMILNANTLKLHKHPPIQHSPLMPRIGAHGESHHGNPKSTFPIFHMFLPA